ncbi:MAG: L-rhamnose mutarotase [Bacteroidales bacterium]|nr:L-rhamnose mutarotase [Bacteroidales bacterium]
MKRYCRTLELRNDKDMIADYIELHSHVWPEVKEGIKSVGILDMQIYIKDNEIFMIMDTVDSFDFDRDMELLSRLPRQKEWEACVSVVQGVEPDTPATEKWKLMEKIFQL